MLYLIGTLNFCVPRLLVTINIKQMRVNNFSVQRPTSDSGLYTLPVARKCKSTDK